MRITKLTKLIVPHIFISGVNSTIHIIAHMLVDIFYWGRGNLWSSIGQAYINIKSLTGTCSIVSLMQCLLPTSWNEHNRVLLLTKLKLPWNHTKSHAWSVKNDLWNNEKFRYHIMKYTSSKRCSRSSNVNNWISEGLSHGQLEFIIVLPWFVICRRLTNNGLQLFPIMLREVHASFKLQYSMLYYQRLRNYEKNNRPILPDCPFTYSQLCATRTMKYMPKELY